MVRCSQQTLTQRRRGTWTPLLRVTVIVHHNGCLCLAFTGVLERSRNQVAQTQIDCMRNIIRRLSTVRITSRTTMATRRAPLVSICHGAGPLPILNHPSQKPLIRSLSQDIRQLLNLDSDHAPRAIAVFTAHWQTKRPAISASKSTDLYFDYYGFPPEGYDVEYNAEGDPDVAQRAFDLLEEGGFQPRQVALSRLRL